MQKEFGEVDPTDDMEARSIIHIDSGTMMRSAFAAGEPIWPNEDDLMFLFSARYNGDAFRKSYVQAEYRERTNAVFTGMVDTIIDRKLKDMSANPRRYQHYAKQLSSTRMQRDAVRERARIFHIDMSTIDVGMLVYDVEVSLERLVDGLIIEHPDLSKSDMSSAQRFMDEQLWNPMAQMLWRHVTAEKLSQLYLYDKLPGMIGLIIGLDSMIRNEFTSGSLQGQDPKNTYIGHLLSDDVIDDCIEEMSSSDYEGMPTDWVVSEVISKVQDADDDAW